MNPAAGHRTAEWSGEAESVARFVPGESAETLVGSAAAPHVFRHLSADRPACLMSAGSTHLGELTATAGAGPLFGSSRRSAARSGGCPMFRSRLHDVPPATAS